jgi:hypothetical protein
MNEELPPLPPKNPQPKLIVTEPPRTPPNFWGMFALGVLLLILSCVLCGPFRSFAPFGVGALVAFVSVFFDGYRGVFMGFLAGIGMSLLVAAIMCGAMLSHQGPM